MDTASFDHAPHKNKYLHWLGWLIGVCALAWCTKPLLDAYFFADDFLFLAIAREIGNPFALLGDHFPEGTLYRPLGVLSWYAAFELFATDPTKHYLLNIALHLINGVLVYSLLEQFNKNTLANIALSLLFTLHPATLSTSAWLSARFDLLATLFLLLNIIFTYRYLQHGTRVSLAVSSLCAIMAIASKETGYLFLPLSYLALAGWRVFPRNRIFLTLASSTLTASLMVAVRLSILPHSPRIPPDLIFSGFSRWAHAFPGNISYGWMIGSHWWSILLATTLLFMIFLWHGRRSANQSRLAAAGSENPESARPPSHLGAALTTTRSGALGVLAIGISLIGLSGIIQAPNAQDLLPPDRNALLQALLSARFYYLPTLGTVLCLSFILQTLGNGHFFGIAKRLELGVVLLIYSCSINYGITTKKILAEWAKGTDYHKALIENSITTSVRHFEQHGPSPIVFINTKPTSWYFSLYSNYILMALLPEKYTRYSALALTEELPPNIPITDSSGYDLGGKLFHKPPKKLGNITFYYPQFPGWTGSKNIKENTAIYKYFNGGPGAPEFRAIGLDDASSAQIRWLQ